MYLGQIVLKMYKNTLVLIQLQYLHGPLKNFHFISSNMYFNNLHSILKSQEFKDFSNRKILVSPTEK